MTDLEKLEEIARQYGQISNFNADSRQTSKEFGSLLTFDMSRPSPKELGTGNDTTKYLKERKEVIFKIMTIKGKLKLYPNPKYIDTVSEIAKKVGLEIGKNLDSHQCWETIQRFEDLWI